MAFWNCSILHLRDPNQHQNDVIRGGTLNIPRSVVLDIVLLDLLDMVIRLWFVHPFAILVCHVPGQAQNWQDQHLEPKNRRREESGHEAMVLGRYIDQRCNRSIGRDKA